MFIVNQWRPAQVNLRAARRLAERERTAPQAKPPAGWGFGGRAPNYSSKQYLNEYFYVTRVHFQDAGGFSSTAR